MPPLSHKVTLSIYTIKLLTRFSLQEGGTKEKEAKRKCRKGNAQEGTFYKKSPLKLP